MKKINLLKVCCNLALSLPCGDFLCATYPPHQGFDHAAVSRVSEARAQPHMTPIEERSALFSTAECLRIPRAKLLEAMPEDIKQCLEDTIYPNLKKLDISGAPSRNTFSTAERGHFKENILAFFRNRSLQRLEHIIATNTPMDLEILEAIKQIPAEPFLRDMEGITWRDPTRRSVAIYVEARGCPALVGKRDEILAFGDPEREVSVIYDSDDQREERRAYITLTVSTDD